MNEYTGQPDYKAIFESTSELYLVLLPNTPTFTIVAVSNAYAKQTMVKREDILGKGVFEVYPDNPDDPNAASVKILSASFNRVIQRKEEDTVILKYDIRLPENEGGGFVERFWSPVNSPVFDADGNIIYIIHKAEDITEFVMLKRQGVEQTKLAEDLLKRSEQMEAEIFVRSRQIHESNQRLEKSEERLRQAVNFAKVGFYDWDVVNDIIVFSPQMQADWGITAGQTLAAVVKHIHPDDQESVNKLIAEAMENKSVYESQYRVIRPDGSVIWIEAKGQITYNESGNPIRFFGTSQNVTVRKNAEIHLANEREKLQKAVSARDEFLSLASHELKTPLTSMKLQSQVLKRLMKKNEAAGLSKEKVKSFIDQSEKQIGRLERLIDDMLDISRIQTGKLTITKEQFNLCDLVKDVVLRMQDQFLSKKYEIPTLKLCSEAVGTWDLMRIEQVVMNLLTNAIRYGQGKPVSLAVESQNGLVTLSVTDQGIGIAEENLDKIFQRFERVSENHFASGLGLGLFLTKQIVEAHGGKIWVTSQLGKGSTFWIELPKNSTSPAELNLI